MDTVKLVFEKIWFVLKAGFKYLARYPFATAATILVVVGAVLLTLFGQKIQIGGILGKLWGKKPEGQDLRVIPPPGRIDSDGKSILPGQSDEKGYVQPVATELKDPGLFSDPNTIVVVHPDKGEVTIPLPTGVKNKDVSEVIEVGPNVYQVKNNDKGVDTGSLLKDLGK